MAGPQVLLATLIDLQRRRARWKAKVASVVLPAHYFNGRIETLMDARDRTPEADELNELAALVDEDESRRWPVDAPTEAEMAALT